MSDDRSREQRRLAAELLATARLITDSNIRASILALAQKWFDLADCEPGQPEALARGACLRAIRNKIGQELRAQYDLPQELSHRMRTLLLQLNDQPDGEHGRATETAN
jgi:hypothetical protein